jgi:hypothetical protein
LERLKIQLNRIKGALQDLEETGNYRERAARFFEIRGYLELFQMDLERLENEDFRTAPERAVRRAIVRQESIEKDHRKNENSG